MKILIDQVERRFFVDPIPPVKEINRDNLIWFLVYHINGRSPEEVLSDTCNRNKLGKRLSDLLKDERLRISQPARVQLEWVLEEFLMASIPLMPCSEFENMCFLKRSYDLEEVASLRGKDGILVDFEFNHRNFEMKFTRDVPHWNPGAPKPFMAQHEFQLKGVENLLQVRANRNNFTYTDKPGFLSPGRRDVPLIKATKKFDFPVEGTVKEVYAERYYQATRQLETMERESQFQFLPPQKDYIARVSCKPRVLVNAKTGVGKTLIAISLTRIHKVKRALVIAPKGTVFGTESNEGFDPAQWEKEVNRFSPGTKVHHLFTQEDVQRVLSAPDKYEGIFLSYPHTLFIDGALETRNEDFIKVKEQFQMEEYPDMTGVGETRGEVTCLYNPSKSYFFRDFFDMIILDEAHCIQNMKSKITQSFLRLNARYQYALTASPIPNILKDIFPILGWLSGPRWFTGRYSYPSFPYFAYRDKVFSSLFLTKEVDLTRTEGLAMAGENRIVQRVSPIPSNVVSLTALIKPLVASISKEDCNPHLVKCAVTEVRVPFSKEQGLLYQKCLNHNNLVGVKPEYRILAQGNILRGVCADPASSEYNINPVMCRTNYTPKVHVTMDLIIKILKAGEQVIVVSSRKGITDEIESRLRVLKVPYSRIDSSVDTKDHSRQAAEFKAQDSKVLLMGIKLAQGYSFDLCRNLILTSLEWSSVTREQAFGRHFRITSKRDVRVWCILNSGSLEEDMYQRVCMKESASSLILTGRTNDRSLILTPPVNILAEHIIKGFDNSGYTISEDIFEQLWKQLEVSYAKETD